MYYSPSKNQWYEPEFQADYESAGTWAADAKEYDRATFDAVVSNRPAGKIMQADANGNPVLVDPPAETADQVRTRYEAAAQALLDATAQSWGYDSLISAASYASSGVAQYKADSQALITWRDALWQKAFSVESDVKAGTIPMPATAEDFLAMLPAPPTRPVA